MQHFSKIEIGSAIKHLNIRCGNSINHDNGMVDGRRIRGVSIRLLAVSFYFIILKEKLVYILMGIKCNNLIGYV